MTNDDIKNALLQRLDTLGRNIPLYDEQIKQGFKEPAFFVLILNSDQTKELHRRYRRSVLFNVQYFPDPESLTVKTDCHTMAEKLYEELEYLEWKEMRFRGHDLHHEVVDEVLHFFISFDVHLIKQKPIETKMQHLEQEERLR